MRLRVSSPSSLCSTTRTIPGSLFASWSAASGLSPTRSASACAVESWRYRSESLIGSLPVEQYLDDRHQHNAEPGRCDPSPVKEL